MSNPQKSQPDERVVPEMRQRLAVNKHGKLTGGQWLEVVTAPIVTVLLLSSPVLMLFATRLLLVPARGLLLAGVLVLFGLLTTTLARAYRYARLPVRYEIMQAKSDFLQTLLLWRSPVFINAQGQEVRFVRRLAPMTFVRAGHSYIVYYLRDNDGHILLSVAPTHHPDAETWRPSRAFNYRLSKRSQNAPGLDKD